MDSQGEAMRWSEVRDRLLSDPYARAEYERQSPLHRLGAAVAVQRTALRLSQAELASRAGVTQRQVSALENGKANVRALTLAKIAAALGTELQLAPELSGFRVSWPIAEFTPFVGTALASSTALSAPGLMTWPYTALAVGTGPTSHGIAAPDSPPRLRLIRRSEEPEAA